MKTQKQENEVIDDLRRLKELKRIQMTELNPLRYKVSVCAFRIVIFEFILEFSTDLEVWETYPIELVRKSRPGSVQTLEIESRVFEKCRDGRISEIVEDIMHCHRDQVIHHLPNNLKDIWQDRLKDYEELMVFDSVVQFRIDENQIGALDLKSGTLKINGKTSDLKGKDQSALFIKTVREKYSDYILEFGEDYVSMFIMISAQTDQADDVMGCSVVNIHLAHVPPLVMLSSPLYFENRESPVPACRKLEYEYNDRMDAEQLFSSISAVLLDQIVQFHSYLVSQSIKQSS
jgi:hypothetical protein